MALVTISLLAPRVAEAAVGVPAVVSAALPWAALAVALGAAITALHYRRKWTAAPTKPLPRAQKAKKVS